MAEQNAIVKPCAISFWNFAVPAMLASAGAAVASRLVKKLYNGESPTVQEAALTATRLGAFWLIGGFAWIAMCKRNGVMK